MYPHFIEVHDKASGYQILLNIECINKVYLDGNSDMSDTWGLIIMKHGNVTTIESYDEVKQLIEDAGCSINRADPRIDTHSSLTMNQIMRILGERYGTATSMGADPLLQSGQRHDPADESRREDLYHDRGRNDPVPVVSDARMITRTIDQVIEELKELSGNVDICWACDKGCLDLEHCLLDEAIEYLKQFRSGILQPSQISLRDIIRKEIK